MTLRAMADAYTIQDIDQAQMADHPQQSAIAEDLNDHQPSASADAASQNGTVEGDDIAHDAENRQQPDDAQGGADNQTDGTDSQQQNMPGMNWNNTTGFNPMMNMNAGFAGFNPMMGKWTVDTYDRTTI